MPTGCRSISSCPGREPGDPGAGEGPRPASSAPWAACAAIEDHAEPAKKAGRRTFATSQSTQLIVGADAARDGDILARSASLYGAYRGAYKLRRVYYSAFSPIPDAASACRCRGRR
jgi:predicted DNA-binding helix-hairpin-helix protein